MAWHSIQWFIPAALAAVVGLQTTEASACTPDPCESSDRFYFFEAAHAAVATDGVLVFRAQRGNGGQLTDEEALGHITLEVTDADGAAVAGQLEPAGEPGLILFRPDAALAADATLTATATIDNESIDDVAECELQASDPADFAVGADPLPEALPELEIAQGYELTPTPTLANLVCCDGAYPQEEPELCFGGGKEVIWSEGYCAAQEGIGRVRGELALPSDLDEAFAANMIIRLVGPEYVSAALGSSDGTLVQASTEPFEVYYEIVDLARAETVAGEALMLGEDLTEQLGEQQIDVTADIEASCEEPAYVCDSQGDGDTAGWDPEACAAWPDDGGTDSDTDGGTDTDGGSDSDTDGGSDSDTDGGSDSDTDGSGESDGGEGSDSDGTAGQDDDGSGCACTADPRNQRGAALMSLFALAGLLQLRRRR